MPPQEAQGERTMPNRHNFVSATLGAGALLATQASHKAAAQADRRQIVDAQVASVEGGIRRTGNGCPAASRKCPSRSPSRNSCR